MVKTKLIEILSGKIAIVKECSKLNAIAIKIVKSAPIDNVVGHFRGCIADVYPGVLPDSENVNNYFNFEHPHYRLIHTTLWEPASSLAVTKPFRWHNDSCFCHAFSL